MSRSWHRDGKSYQNSLKINTTQYHGQQMLSVLSSFLLALLLHPRVLQKAREELDQVVGTERLPDFDDRKHLAYMECVLQEVYRFVISSCIAMTI